MQGSPQARSVTHQASPPNRVTVGVGLVLVLVFGLSSTISSQVVSILRVQYYDEDEGEGF